MWHSLEVLKATDTEMLKNAFSKVNLSYTEDPVELAKVLRIKPQGTVYSFKMELEKISPTWANKMVSDVMFCYMTPAIEI